MSTSFNDDDVGLSLLSAQILAAVRTRSAPPLTREQEQARAKRAERAAWNKEVEERKAEKRRLKGKS